MSILFNKDRTRVELMHGQVQKWGNSLGVRIPKALAHKLNLHSGTQIEVELDASNCHLVITKAESELDLLLNQINISNLHSESFVDDESTGSESW